MMSVEHKSFSLAGAAVVVPRGSSLPVRIAGTEIARCLRLMTGKGSPVLGHAPERGASVILERSDRFGMEKQGYRLAAEKRGWRHSVSVGARTPAGILYGAYGLLEMLGMGFLAGGETFPDRPAPAQVPLDLNISAEPAFAVRGDMLHYNFLCGCTTWGLNDYRFYFDQLARMRCNMLLMHWYDDEPGAAYEVNGAYLAGGVTPNTLTRPWGAVSSLRTSEFSFGTGRFFDEEIFSSPMGEDLPDLITEIKRTEFMFNEAAGYARDLCIEVAAGFEAPREDPAEPEVRERFKARVRQFVERNPNLSRFALWEHEGGGGIGSTPPRSGSRGEKLLSERRNIFAYLGNEQRVWEAVRFGRFAEIACEVLEKEFSHLKLVLVGWGGDRWMQFADYCLAYDKILPRSVAFTCHDNIEASMGPTVSGPWGELPQERERWAMPWVECDTNDCLVRQPNVENLALLAPDALRKKCQGLLTLHWRTRDVEEETAFAARFAWDTGLTPEKFFRTMARQAFGLVQEKRMATHLAALQRMGSRWTGVRGTSECSRMVWTGWKPHFPFEVDGKAADYLAKRAGAAAEALAEIPMTDDSEAAFHLVQGVKGKKVRTDPKRPGVEELKAAAEQLRCLKSENNPKILRCKFAKIEESIFSIRPKLVAFGMTSRSYQMLDTFLFAIRHVRCNAGAKEHMAKLKAIRTDLDRLRRWYVAQGHPARMERLDYLAATIDFAMHFDSAAMLLADGELIEQAIVKAEKEKSAGSINAAADTAAKAYAELIEAGMERACAAFTRKLTTRCDFGTLATLNVKHLAGYWQTIEKLESFMPASPPREIQVRCTSHEVRLSWRPDGRAVFQNLYRRSDKNGKWQCVNREPLQGKCQMFIDRPARTGSYVYAVTALDGNGWESPLSHPVYVHCGLSGNRPHIAAGKPFSRLSGGDDLSLRVSVVSDLPVKSVTLFWRMAGETIWRQTPLYRRFRSSYHGGVPGTLLKPGIVEFYVEAAADGARSIWPESAPALPWTAFIIGELK